METVSLVTALIDLGLPGVSLVFVIALWNRLNKVTDRMLEMQEEAKAERHQLKAQITALQLGRDLSEEEKGGD